MSYKLLKVPPLEGFHPPPEVDKSADPDSLYLPAYGGGEVVCGGGGLQSSSNTVSVIGTQSNLFFPVSEKIYAICKKNSIFPL